jgi:hypothetical protein
MVHSSLESIERTVKLWPLEFKIEWVTVSATFCTPASKVVQGPVTRSLSGPQGLPQNFGNILLHTRYILKCKYIFFQSNDNHYALLNRGKGISELKEFPFISKFCVGFEIQLMDTTKFSCTVSKIDSHNIWRLR